MPVKDRQTIITDIVSTVLGEVAQVGKRFDWFINKHEREHFGGQFELIEKIFDSLNGDSSASILKRRVPLECDAYFAGKYNFIFEFDEFQHFSSARLKTIALYPTDLKLNYEIEQWKKFCELNYLKADRYRENKKTPDFNFSGGRTAQRAYLDCFRDLLPVNNKLNPTLRISEFQVADISSKSSESCKKVEKLLNKIL